MPAIASTSVMISKLSGLLGTGDLSIREHDFIERLAKISAAGEVTKLSEKQIEWLSDLHGKHFG